MRGYLVRVGVDQEFGKWNAPVDAKSGEFVYVPIPEGSSSQFHPGFKTTYDEFLPALENFAAQRSFDLHKDLEMPQELLGAATHLDPDFKCLTYGDVGDKRGAGIATLGEGDLLVFYSGLRPTAEGGRPLNYALIGLMIVETITPVISIPKEQWQENAHTRRLHEGRKDIVVRAKRGVSGRLKRCIPIGSYRQNAYRVTEDVLAKWGGLGVRNGYIQRSANPPELLDADKFYRWFCDQDIPLVSRNY